MQGGVHPVRASVRRRLTRSRGMPGSTLPLSVATVFGLPLAALLGQALAQIYDRHATRVPPAPSSGGSEHPAFPNESPGARPSIGRFKRSLSMLIRGSPHLGPTAPAHKIPDSFATRLATP